MGTELKYLQSIVNKLRRQEERNIEREKCSSKQNKRFSVKLALAFFLFGILFDRLLSVFIS